MREFRAREKYHVQNLHERKRDRSIAALTAVRAQSRRKFHNILMATTTLKGGQYESTNSQQKCT